ncbi:hypothetical protein EDD37DRAFT_59818 [Exophiala viscosa]|uniref:Peptidase C14 caspase domain-containing protein n=1 Tax=Exophiala viscosa TaxID=2486360 RepID=A0AAN6IH35_9EURO|nr:hypothetical protein EDD36DRAFT_147500 [Exophiala viscosa]KAI1629602.1 hypothetical protein EDD37DRAFT_59818 [Exophiala viscosa]
MSGRSTCVPVTQPAKQERICDTTAHGADGSVDESPSDAVKIHLQGLFAKEMQSAAQARTHEKVAVLLIQWEPEGEDFLDTREEVENLRVVFENIYHFSVHQATLRTSPTNFPKKQLNYHIAKLINEEDVGNALLIVYYAGHAITKEGELWLSGGNPKEHLSDHETQILWDDVERHLVDADADLLVIFDCCYAGALAYDARAPQSPNRIFEYIGGTLRDRTAEGPGETSFTNALVWALKQLSERVGGFTANKLVSVIRDAPYFRKTTQEPIWSPRGEAESCYMLNIVPLTAQGPVPERSDVYRREDAKTIFLDLQLCFDKCPRDKDIVGLTTTLKNLIRREDLPLKQVRWRGLSNVDIKPDMRDVAWKVLQQVKQRKLHTRSHIGKVLTSGPIGETQEAGNNGHLAKQRKIKLVGWMNLRSWHHYAARALKCTTWDFVQQCLWSGSKRHAGPLRS